MSKSKFRNHFSHFVMTVLTLLLLNCASRIKSPVSAGVDSAMFNTIKSATSGDIFELFKSTAAYYQVNNKWPEKADDLSAIDFAMDSVNNISHFSHLDFHPSGDSLKINYILPDPDKSIDNTLRGQLVVGRENGEFTFTVLDEELK